MADNKQYPDNEEYIEISIDTGNVEQIEATLRHLLKETRFYDGLDDIVDNWEDIRTGYPDGAKLLGDKTKTTCCAILSSINTEASSALSMYFYSTRLGPKDENAFDLIEKNHLRNNLPIAVEKMRLEGLVEKIKFENLISPAASQESPLGLKSKGENPHSLSVHKI